MMSLTSGNLENLILFVENKTVMWKKVSLLGMFATISPVYLIFLLEMKEKKSRPLDLLCFLHMKNKGVRKKTILIFSLCAVLHAPYTINIVISAIIHSTPLRPE